MDEHTRQAYKEIALRNLPKGAEIINVEEQIGTIEGLRKVVLVTYKYLGKTCTSTFPAKKKDVKMFELEQENIKLKKRIRELEVTLARYNEEIDFDYHELPDNWEKVI